MKRSLMKRSVGASLTMATLLGMTVTAQATEYWFTASGGGISASGYVYVSPTSTPGTLTITGASGSYADTTDGISGSITGVQWSPAPASAPPFPAPAFTPSGFSYDNLFYPSGVSPVVCTGYPFGGGYLDVYGIALSVSGGYTVNVWSNGGPFGYGAGDAQGSVKLNDPSEYGVPVSVTGSIVTPGPGSMVMYGASLIGLAARKRRKLYANS